MAEKQRIVACGTALALVLLLALAAPAQDWVNPDGSRVGESELGDPGPRKLDNEARTMTRREKGGVPEYEPPTEFVPRPPLESNPGVRRSAEFPIPRGHLPPPGACRVWFLDRPPGHQPPPGPCEQLEWRVPDGAILVRG